MLLMIIAFSSPAETRRAGGGGCFNYFVNLVIRHDPPINFPWDKAVKDLKRFSPEISAVNMWVMVRQNFDSAQSDQSLRCSLYG